MKQNFSVNQNEKSEKKKAKRSQKERKKMSFDSEKIARNYFLFVICVTRTFSKTNDKEKQRQELITFTARKAARLHFPTRKANATTHSICIINHQAIFLSLSSFRSSSKSIPSTLNGNDEIECAETIFSFLVQLE